MNWEPVRITITGEQIANAREGAFQQFVNRELARLMEDIKRREEAAFMKAYWADYLPSTDEWIDYGL